MITDADIVSIVMQLLKGIPELLEVVGDAIAGKRPDLVPAPPASEGGHILAEDASVIAKRFGEPAPQAAREP